MMPTLSDIGCVLSRRWPRRLAGGMVIVSMCALLVASALAQQLSEPASEQPPASGIGAVRDLEARLTALNGNEPMGYFMLAEDIAAVAETPRGFELARELFVLAWETDRVAQAPLRIGPSVCLALADLATGDERRWLLALAASMDEPEGVVAPWMAPSFNAIADERAGQGELQQSFALAEALGHIRAGSAVRAASVLDSDALERALARSGLTATDIRRVRTIVEAVLTRPRCPRCKNERVVRAPENAGRRFDTCPTCGGHPGPNLSRDDLTLTLRAEAALLGVGSSRWSAQRRIDGAAPLRPLDAADLAAIIGLDADARTYIFEPGSPLFGTWR